MTSTEPVGAPEREWVIPGVMLCPKCQGVVGVRDDGTLFDHDRYADGAGPNPDQPHDQIRCEGERP